MKNYVALLVALTSFFSLSCIAQRSDRGPANAPFENTHFDGNPNDGLVIVSYHVEERINMKMGTRITTYDVPKLSMVDTYDMGSTNSRVVTPIYGKPKVKKTDEAVALALATTIIGKPEQPKAVINIIALPITPVVVEEVVAKEKTKFVKINLIDTYERILEKGYESIDMLKRVGNSRYFEGDLAVAAKWYTKLFSLTADLEASYYYRYAQSLKSISQNDKADQMMAIFETKNL